MEENASVTYEKLGRINRDTPLYKRLLGLDGAPQHLTCLIPSGNSGQMLMRSSMPFDEAYGVFNSLQGLYTPRETAIS